jgi:hypothetical protein
VLVNNAGIMKLATIADSDDALFDRQIAVNLKGTFNTLREAARRLRDGGRIVNVSSSVVGLLQPTYGVYAATKAAVEAMTSVLTKELRGRNITVNAIAPGPTATKLFLDGKPQAVDRSPDQAGPAGTPGPARGHRRRHRLPGRPGRRLDQRPDPARQRRDHLSPGPPPDTSLQPTRHDQEPSSCPSKSSRHRRLQRLRPAQRQGPGPGRPHRLRLDARDRRAATRPQVAAVAAGPPSKASTCAPSSWTSPATPRSRPASPGSSPTTAAWTSSSTTPAT